MILQVKLMTYKSDENNFTAAPKRSFYFYETRIHTEPKEESHSEEAESGPLTLTKTSIVDSTSQIHNL